MKAAPDRVTLTYKNCSEKFLQQSLDYGRQYCSIYLARLKDMEPYLLEKITGKWGDKYPICQLHKLTEQHYEKCVVIGTFFKDQKLKPSILKQLAESNQLDPQPILSNFADDSDLLYIEDEVQRYQVLGNVDPATLVTGITCALLGRDLGKGKFEVEECVFPDFRAQIPRTPIDDPIFILFLSGLDFLNQAKLSVNLKLLSYWLTGLAGNTEQVSKIARVIIAGNSIRTVPEKLQQTISMVSRVAESSESIEAVKSFDSFLTQLCQVIEVDVLPGECDPSNHILPQKPMHWCMFPQASAYKSLRHVSNPYFCEMEGLKVMGTSGQPIHDIIKYSDIVDPLEAMESCLKWNHIAPTAPDTLGCFPYYNSDPFILDDCPHIFFAGNQKEFSTRIAEGSEGQKVRLLGIPKFCSTSQAVLLNLKDLNCEVVNFASLQA